MKPVCDKLATLLLIVLCMPICLFSALVLAILNGGNVFFYQTRIGEGEEPFQLLKFRTMTDYVKSFNIDERQRITPFGFFFKEVFY